MKRLLLAAKARAAMPKKAKKGSKKGSKGGFDWATADREKWAHVEVRNNRWCTMRFTACSSGAAVD